VGDGIARFLGEDAQQPHILAHDHRHSRANLRHRTDRRDETDADQSTDDPAARRAENMSPGNLGYVELASYLINRRSIEKVRVEADVEYITVVIAMKIE
jgi:hypothetical protein